MVAAWLAASAAVPEAARAITRNVDNGVACSDAAPCTVTPCCTIQFAIDVAVANDVILVAAGTYPENLTLAKNVSLRGAQTGNPACDRLDVETIVAPPAGVALTLTTGAANATIDGFTFQGGTRGIEQVAGPLDRLKILNNRFVDFTDSGVFFGASAPSLRFEQNAIDGASAVGTSGLFHLDDDHDFDGLAFRDTCVANGVHTYGFFADGDHNVGPNVDAGSPLIEDSRFENNRVGVGLGRRSGDQLSVARNTFAGNALDGLQGGLQNSIVDGNFFGGNGRHGLLLTSFGDGDPGSGAQANAVTGNCFTSNGHGSACAGGSNDGTPCTTDAVCTGGGTCSAPLAGAGIAFSDTQAAGTIASNAANANNFYFNSAGAAYGGGETIDLESNWWGCATGPNTAGCDSASPSLDTDPFLATPSETAPCDPLNEPTPTPTTAATPTLGPTPGTTATGTPTPTATGTPSPTATATSTPSPTATPSPTPTASPTTTPTPSATATPTPSTSPTPTVSGTPHPSASPTFPATPIATATDGATPTAPATPDPTPTPGPLNHFQCYETHRPPLRIDGIALADHFGATTVRLLRGKRFCAPADKNDEDPSAPLDADHLTAYTIKQTAPRFTPVRGLSVTNQFGTIELDLVRPDALLVPSGKSHDEPLAGYVPLVDHFKCYKARGRFRSTTDLAIEDQFGSIVAAIKRPVRYCAPVDKNGEGVIDGGTHLLCYQVRAAAGAPTHDTLYSLNQLGPDAFRIFGPRELCVPSSIP